MTNLKKRKSVLQKQMPTLLGILVLVIALVAGLLLFGKGTGVFAPRASAETTPKNVRLSNVTDNSFTVSFFTDEAAIGFIKYGTKANKLNSQASDDRVQLSGTTGNYNVHHITVRGLEPNVTYYYVLGTGSSGTTFDNNGAPFSVATAAQLSSAPESTMIYGNVYNAAGTPGEGSVVYVTISGVGDLSALVRNTGGWGIPLATARTTDGRAAADYDEETSLGIIVQGNKLSDIARYQTTVGEAQPAADIILGQTIAASPSPKRIPTNSSSPSPTIVPTVQPTLDPDGNLGVTEASDSGELGEVSTASAVLTLSGNDIGTPSAVVKEQPIIKGQAAPNAEVKFEIHSDNEITSSVVADENGEFSLDLAALGETLEPGEHTVTYSYIDPNTGEEVVRTETFIVEGSQESASSTTESTLDSSAAGSQLAQANTSYGSGSPYSNITPGPTLIPTTSSSSKGETTRSAAISTTSGTFNAGSFETTLALVAIGFFFITGGIWSWWLAVKVEE